uniref:Ig-like domain-containing protein n=1 Tax=Denticeps clupeoides TaxID=299321 RepID=A0AAY4B3D7_9TELE
FFNRHVMTSLLLLCACLHVISADIYFGDPAGEDSSLSVSIPVDQTLQPLLGGKVVVPCYFRKNPAHDPVSPAGLPALYRIKWSFIRQDKVSVVLVAFGGVALVEPEYLDRVTLVNYPTILTDATMELTELRSSDSGTYRCEVMHETEDSSDSVDVRVQGGSPSWRPQSSVPSWAPSWPPRGSCIWRGRPAWTCVPRAGWPTGVCVTRST